MSPAWTVIALVIESRGEEIPLWSGIKSARSAGELRQRSYRSRYTDRGDATTRPLSFPICVPGHVTETDIAWCPEAKTSSRPRLSTARRNASSRGTECVPDTSYPDVGERDARGSNGSVATTMTWTTRSTWRGRATCRRRPTTLRRDPDHHRDPRSAHARLFWRRDDARRPRTERSSRHRGRPRGRWDAERGFAAPHPCGFLLPTHRWHTDRVPFETR